MPTGAVLYVWNPTLKEYKPFDNADLSSISGGTPIPSVPGTPQTDTATAVANDFAAALASRTGFIFRNAGSNDIYLAANITATTANAIAVVQPNGYYEAPREFAPASWSAIAPGGSTAFVYIESI